MLPSNNNNNNSNNIIYENNLNTDNNPLVTNYHHNLFSTISSSSYFPTSPFSHYDTDYFFLEPYQHLPLEEATTTTKTAQVNEMMISKIDDITNNKEEEVIVESAKKSIAAKPGNRSSKKDRHSKINTAKGPRDRRMRLSLEIAKDFFGLQDMLGFDKASATVEWLLTKAKHDIKKVVASAGASISSDRLIHTIDSGSVVFNARSASPTSECEVISGIVDHQDKPIISKCGTTAATKEKTKHKEVKTPVVRSIRTRDMRKKAREKARERTKVKKFAETNLVLVEEYSNHAASSSWTPPLEVENTARAQERGWVGAPINIVDTDVDHDSFQSFVMMEKWSPASIFNHLQGRMEEHQIEDFQVYGKPWDYYNIQNLL